MNHRKTNPINIQLYKIRVNFLLLYFLSGLLSFLVGCYPISGGYRGLRYDTVNTKSISFDCKTNTLIWNDIVVKTLTLYVLKESGRQENLEIFRKYVDTVLNEGSFYEFSDSLFKMVKNINITIHLDIDDLGDKMYTVKVTPENWINKELVFGYVRQYR